MAVDLTLDVLTVAPALLGAHVRVHGVTLLLTEVEAYAGTDDPAAHAYRGWRPHTRHLFEPPGTLYCYRSYGIHICANVVCGPAGSGSAVLLRAGRVVDGLEFARSRRPGVPDARLARGHRFGVAGMTGPLKRGELERARAWGARLARELRG